MSPAPAPLAYAIDFGTTNTLLAAAYDDRVDVLKLGETEAALRSLLFLHRDADPVLGHRALTSFQAVGMSRTNCGTCPLAHYNGKEIESECIQATLGGSCNDAKLLFQLKTWLADDDEVAIHAWAREWSIEDLVAMFLRRLKEAGDRVTGHDVRRLTLGHPVVFDGANGHEFEELQELAKHRLQVAAARAGFEEVILLDEPTAASHNDLPDGTVMAVDFGGGTFDVAIIHYSPTSGKLLALEGIAVGGEAYDGALLQETLGAQLGLGHPKLPNWVRGAFSTRRSAITAIEGGDLLQAVKGTGGDGLDLLAYAIENGAVYKLFDAVEQAKIQLSDPAARAGEIFVALPVAKIRQRITLKQLEAATGHLNQQVQDVIDKAMATAGVQAADIDLVIRTGGSSDMRPFLQGLERRFGTSKVQRSDTASMVVQGLGLHAIKKWGN